MMYFLIHVLVFVIKRGLTGLYRKIAPIGNFDADPDMSVRMKTSSNENIFYITGPLCGDSLVTCEFPSQRPVTWSFDIFSELRLNKRLSKQPKRRWFETPSRLLWRHCNCIRFIPTSPTIYEEYIIHLSLL